MIAQIWLLDHLLEVLCKWLQKSDRSYQPPFLRWKIFKIPVGNHPIRTPYETCTVQKFGQKPKSEWSLDHWDYGRKNVCQTIETKVNNGRPFFTAFKIRAINSEYRIRPVNWSEKCLKMKVFLVIVRFLKVLVYFLKPKVTDKSLISALNRFLCHLNPKLSRKPLFSWTEIYLWFDFWVF